MRETFGIYILTYPGDYHLAQALLSSLRHFNPDIPVMIIPGSGFDRNDHPFPEEMIMPEPEQAEWATLGAYDRLFWIFQGPYDKFLYCDADILCLNNIQGLVDRVHREKGAFMYVNLPYHGYGEQEDENSAYQDDRLSKIEKGGQLGILENIRKFDPDYDFYRNYPFNTGLLASSKSTLSPRDFFAFRESELAFYKEVLHQPFDPKGFAPLFYADQGRLNYLVYKHHIPLKPLYPDAHYRWGGDTVEVGLADALAGNSPYPFIHWAGCPRPSHSIFAAGPLFYFLYKSFDSLRYNFSPEREIPGLRVWKRFAPKRTWGRMATYSWRDFKNKIWPRLKGIIKRSF